MTERIYYTDPSCRVFEATVVRAAGHDGRTAIVLDRTAFYPTSGGQPFDTGRLGDVDLGSVDAGRDVRVIETIDQDDEILHVVEASIPAGTRVKGEIDWPRRIDHMQQHTGQHVLSAAFDRLFQNRTTSFHMGAEVSTIDLARELRPDAVERAVEDANRIVWEDRPVSIRFASEEEAAHLTLRKEPVRQGPLRLVEVDSYDLSACGGTHVARTGSIGLIGVLHTERFKGGMRVTFVCGGRASRALKGYRDAVAGTVRLLSVLPHELPEAVGRLQADLKDVRKLLGRFQAALAAHEATRLLGDADAAGNAGLVVKALDGWDAPGLKAIASALASQPGVTAILFSGASPAQVVVARSADVAVDAGAVLRQLTERFGGRGGGKPDLAQGGGLSGTPAELTQAARSLIG